MDQIEPSMAVSVPGQISGEAVIADLCDRIAQRLERSCDLRTTDAYRCYSAHVEITLQLLDVDRTEVRSTVVVGQIDPRQRIEVIVSDVPSVTGGVADDSAALEKPIDPAGITEAPPKKTTRQYVSRVRSRR